MSKTIFVVVTHKTILFTLWLVSRVLCAIPQLFLFLTRNVIAQNLSNFPGGKCLLQTKREEGKRKFSSQTVAIFNSVSWDTPSKMVGNEQ